MPILLALLLAAPAQPGMDLYAKALELHQAGKFEQAVALYQQSWELGARPPGSLYNHACAEARLGHAEKAVELLKQPVEGGFATAQLLQDDEDLASLKGTPRFAKLLARARELGNPCDKPEFRAFDFWLGDWVVTSPGGAPLGKSRVTKILNGCALLEEWTAGNGQTGKSFNVYDPQAKRWRQTWVDDHARQTDYAGPMEGGALKYEADMPGGVRMKMTFSRLEGGKVHQLMEAFKDGASAGTAFDGIYSHPQ